MGRRFQLRAQRHGLHGPVHVQKQRRRALILIVSGFVRSAAWIMLGLMYISGVHFARTAFASVAFVALMSCYANAATDFGQGCASLADLSAGDAHHDAEHNRAALDIDVNQLENDIAQLAELHPGPEAQQLFDEIRGRIKGKP